MAFLLVKKIWVNVTFCTAVRLQNHGKFGLRGISGAGSVLITTRIRI